MTIRFWEKPKSRSATVDIKNPKTKRTWGSSGSSVKTDVLLAFASVMPAYDITIDAVTGAVINVYPYHIECEEVSGAGDSVGIFDITVDFQARSSVADSLTNPSGVPTTEATNSASISFNFGVQTVNIKTAIADVRAYNCVSPSSAGTQTAADAADTAAEAVFTAADALTAAQATLTAEIASATAAANVVGVTPAVKVDCLLAAGYAEDTATDGDAAYTAAYGVGGATRDTAASARAGDRASAATYYGYAVTYRATVATEEGDADLHSGNADASADDATAGILNAYDTTAAAAAHDAADAALALYALILTLDTACAAAVAAALAAKNAVDADAAPGGNVPEFNRMIGVNGGEVQGIDIEVGTVEITVEKKWARATLSSTYLATLATYIDRSPVAAEDPFTLTWFGQVLSFPRGTLRLRTATVKNDSAFSLEIAYSLSYQRNISTSENFTIGNSLPIEKKGHEAYWIFSRAQDNNNATVPTPQSVHIVQVYPYLPFAALNL